MNILDKTPSSFDFSQLNIDFAQKAEDLLDLMQESGLTFKPTSGLRTLEVQAKLWRQSRTKAVINAEIAKLNTQGCDYLAHVILSVGPQYGPHVTNAIPGLSAHNWGEAMDCVFVEATKAGSFVEMHTGGMPIKEYIELHPEVLNNDPYKELADQAIKIGLWAGYYFKSFPDAGHIQLYKKEILERMTLKDVNDHFAQGAPILV